MNGCIKKIPQGSRRLFLLHLLAVWMLTFAGSALAQYDTGAVIGTVTDSAGLPVPHAAVTLHDTQKGSDQKASTTSKGEYTFPTVAVGNYVVVVDAPTFGRATSAAFDVAVSGRNRIDIPLKVSTTETVAVNASGDVTLDTDNNERGLVVEQAEINNLPLNGREYADLAELAPGVQVSGDLQNNAVDKREGSFNVNGMRSTVNNFLMDGLDNNAYQTSGLGYNNQAVPESIGTVQEFKIITTDYPAQYGRSGGAIVNVSTLSGTNKLHGSAWEYIRNGALDAASPYRATNLVQNQFGANTGGPIQRDKFFYFVSYEGFRQRTDNYLFASLPTADQKAGYFYQTDSSGNPTGPIPVQNPLTTAIEPTGTTPAGVAATIIPSGQITPFAAAVLAALPTPSTLGGDNFKYLVPNFNNRDNASLRLDRNFGTRLQTFVRFTDQASHITELSAIPGLAGGEGSNGHGYLDGKRIASGLTYMVRANSVFDARFGVTWDRSGTSPLSYGRSGFYQQYNIPLPIDPKAGLMVLNGQNLNDFDVFGVNGSPQSQNPFEINAKGTYNLVFGRHSVSFGYEYLSVEDPTTWNSPIFGSDYYDSTFAKPSSTSTTGLSSIDKTEYLQAWSLTEFMYGARSRYSLGNYVTLDYMSRFHNAYIQDSWRALSKLTLNYGLRYEFTEPIWEANNRSANYNPASNSLVLAHGDSIAGRSLVNPQKANFSPRFGAAYSITKRWVWRSGYGISYIQWNRYGQDGSLGSNGPYTVHSIVTNNLGETLCSNASQSLNCFRTTTQGYPSSLISPQQFNPTAAVTVYIPKNSPTGYLQFYSLGTQLELARNTLLDVAYVGTHGVHIRVLTDYNQRPYQGAPLARPDPSFGDIYDNIPAGFMKYNSLQVKFQHQSKMFDLVNSFTWSQARDNAGGDGETRDGDGTFVNLYNIKGDAGVSGYNQPLNESAAVFLNLPTPFASHLWSREALGGWRLTSILRMTSGLPINLNYNPSASQLVTDANYSFRPDISCPAKSIYNPKSEWVRTQEGTIINVLNKSCISSPLTRAIPTPFGNSPRNGIRNVPAYNMDAGLNKTFDLPETLKLELRAEFFNVLNHVNWHTPSAGLNATIGTISVADAQRELQLAVRLQF